MELVKFQLTRQKSRICWVCRNDAVVVDYQSEEASKLEDRPTVTAK